MKNLNFYKLGFSIIYIIACLSISMSAYYKQNFKDYAKILISYSQFQFEAHSKVKKLFRDKDFYTLWKNDYEWAGDIYDFIKVGEFDLKKGYVKNKTVNFDVLRETAQIYAVEIEKVEMNDFRTIVEYLIHCTKSVEENYIEKYPNINFQVSFPSAFYKKGFRNFEFFIFLGILGGLFSLSLILYAYNEIKSLKLLK